MSYQGVINKNEVYFQPVFSGRRFFREFKFLNWLRRMFMI